MPTFTCLLTDLRYRVPTLHLFIASTETEARELARRELKSSPYHRSFELLEGERVIGVEHQGAGDQADSSPRASRASIHASAASRSGKSIAEG